MKVLDSGAIVAQEAIEIPDGISYSELEEQSAELGGKLAGSECLGYL